MVFAPLHHGENAAGESQTPFDYYTHCIVAPASGRLRKVFYRCKNGDPGDVSFGIYTGDYYNKINTPGQATLVESSATKATSNTETDVFTFAQSNHFTSGSVILIGLDRSIGSTNAKINITAEIEYMTSS